MRHTPHVCTRTRTSRAAGSGISRRTRSSGCSSIGAGCRTRHAHISGTAVRFLVGQGLPAVGEADDRLGEQLDEVDRREHVVAHDRLELRDLVGDGFVAIAVALEHAPRGRGREPVVEAHVQQREAGRLVAP